MNTVSVSKTPTSPFHSDRLAALKRGHRFASFVALRGEAYHKTPEAAEKSARRRARAAFPGNPPNWDVVELIP